MSSAQSIVVDEEFINKAATILNDLWDEVCTDERAYTSCEVKPQVDFVLSSNTKTWPYILMTQLLGKATDERVNIFSMHKSSELDGAWDARSLCEHVITRNDGFEATVMQGLLGGVKQPYNNSPGQKPSLSKSNKTMKSHIPIRDAIISALEQTNTSAEALENLGYFLRACHGMLLQVISDNELETEANLKPVDLARLRRFLVDLAQDGRDGEGLSLAVALILSLTFVEKSGYSVLLYPINSSRKHAGEHEDLEIYLGTEKFAAFELKDKPFSASEVLSSASKAWGGGFARFCFVYGPGAGNVVFDPISPSSRLDQENLRTFASCISVEQLIDSLLLLLTEVNHEQIRLLTVRLLEDAHVKARTQTITRSLLRELTSNKG